MGTPFSRLPRMIYNFVDRFKDLLKPNAANLGSVPSGEFVKGINLGGASVTLEGLAGASMQKVTVSMCQKA